MDDNKLNTATTSTYGLPHSAQYGIPGLALTDIKQHYQPTKTNHQHNFYELFIVTAGSGYHLLDFKQYPIQPNTVFLIRPNQIHRIFDLHNLTGTFIMFDQSIKLAMFANTIHYQSFSLFGPGLVSLTASMTPVIEQLRTTLKSNVHLQRDIACCQLKQLLLTIEQSIMTSPSTTTKPVLIHDFFYYLDTATTPYKFVYQLANKLCVTPNYLNEFIKKHTSNCAQFWIKDQLILRAKRLLITTNYPINHIATTLNFADSPTFCKAFKLHTNHSPAAWRKTHSMA